MEENIDFPSLVGKKIMYKPVEAACEVIKVEQQNMIDAEGNDVGCSICCIRLSSN